MFPRLPERNCANRLRTFAFRPEHVFRNENQNRIVTMHRGPKQTGGVFGRARNDDGESGIMREDRLVRLTMPQTAAGKISSVGRVNHGRTLPMTKRTPAQIRDIGYQLIEPRINEIDKLKLENWPAAVRSKTARNAENR